MTRNLLLAILIALATGCSIFGDDDTPIDPPADLPDFIEADITAMSTMRCKTFES